MYESDKVPKSCGFESIYSLDLGAFLDNFSKILNTLEYPKVILNNCESERRCLLRQFICLDTAIITSSGASTRIENALMSDEAIEEFVAKGKPITRLSSRSEREVAGYIRVLEYLYETARLLP